MEKERKTDDYRCKNCGSGQTYIRKSVDENGKRLNNLKERYCRICGYSEMIEVKGENGNTKS